MILRLFPAISSAPAAAAKLAAALAAVWLAPLAAQAQDKPFFIELYTSQGCSSCPPADKLLTEIARQPHVVAVALPVDYWDYIGWKDTFAKASHTERQKAYGKARGDGQVYTPQAVINGIRHVIGSDIEAIRKAANYTHGRYGVLSVPMHVTEKVGGLEVTLGAAAADVPNRQGTLWLIRVKKESTVSIGRGENSGRTITYANIGRSALRVGEWNGEAARFEIAASSVASPESDGWVLYLQAMTEKGLGPILAAAKPKGQ